MGFIENDTARTILSLAVMLTAGFLVTRVTKRLHLPNVTGYILAGILIGPCVFGLIPADMIGGMGSLPTSRLPSSPLASENISNGRS